MYAQDIRPAVRSLFVHWLDDAPHSTADQGQTVKDVIGLERFAASLLRLDGDLDRVYELIQRFSDVGGHTLMEQTSWQSLL